MFLKTVLITSFLIAIFLASACVVHQTKTAPALSSTAAGAGGENEEEAVSLLQVSEGTDPALLYQSMSDDVSLSDATDLPELEIDYFYDAPGHKLEALVVLTPVAETGCAERHIRRFFPHREISEEMRFCFEKKLWEELEDVLEAADLFSYESDFKCKNPGETRPTIELKVRKKEKKVTLGPICVDEKGDLPLPLFNLLEKIKNLTLPPH